MMLQRVFKPRSFIVSKWFDYSTSLSVRMVSDHRRKVSNPSPLATLRKRTGYPLSFCKKALADNDNDVDKAFVWLQVSLENLKKYMQIT